MEISNLEKLLASHPLKEKMERDIVKKIEEMECKEHKQKTVALIYRNQATGLDPCCQNFERKIEQEIQKIADNYSKQLAASQEKK